MQGQRDKDPWGLDRSDFRSRRFEDTVPGDWSSSLNSTFTQRSRRVPPPRRTTAGFRLAATSALALVVSALSAFAWALLT